jgi:hypothetical protein
MGYEIFCFGFLRRSCWVQVKGGRKNSYTRGATVIFTGHLLNTKRLNTQYSEDQLSHHLELTDDEALHPKVLNASNLRSLLGDLFTQKS